MGWRAREDAVRSALERATWKHRAKWVAIAVVVVGALALAVQAVADDDPPKTSLTVCTGTLPATSLLSDHDGACYDYDVSATEKLSADLLNHEDDDTFRHVYWREGDPACVFTARVRYPNPDQPSWARTRLLSDVSGGRECNRQTRDGQCAYIAQGYSILAVTGASCSQAGVPLCGGPFCI